ncbi:MAG TPA: hypothetical protein VEM15_05545 [Thermodesulfobacteriota bacterium]|nr:hypothetical protein [Thermodesulfobacteriota bacterium]
MIRLNQEEGRYRVLLIGIGDNSEEQRSSFCSNVSKNYSIPVPFLRKIVDGSPVILKKNIPFKKADALAKALRSFGARVLVEKKRNHPPLSLEFQELSPHQLALESSSLRRTERGAWIVTGRVKNISDQTLTDTWVLVQLFDDLDEFIAFEETPLAINPLPSGEASPFKLIFEGNLFIKRVSIAFKNASGQPIPAVDKKRRREWTEVPIGEDRLPRMSTGSEKRVQAISLITPSPSLSPPLEPLEKILETSSSELEKDGHLGEEESKGASGQETSAGFDSSAKSEIEKETEEGRALGEINLVSDEKEVDGGLLLIACEPQGGLRLPEGITEIPEGQAEEKGTAEGEEVPSFAWIESFRNVVKAYYEKPYDAFSIWFKECQAGGGLKDSFHALLTLLVHSRFEQGHPSVTALDNTKRVFELISQRNVSLSEIPALEGTSFASGEAWRNMFHRALPKIRQIGNTILEKNTWSASDLETLIQVIPHMDHQGSRRAIQWMNELIGDVAKIDFFDTPVTVGKGLYRVASRLGIVDPNSDYYEGRNSAGDGKIQSFARAAFPRNPRTVEEPMARMGRAEAEGGHCFPVQPWCEGCFFETFCLRLCVRFDPSENGMRE